MVGWEPEVGVSAVVVVMVEVFFVFDCGDGCTGGGSREMYIGLSCSGGRPD